MGHEEKWRGVRSAGLRQGYPVSEWPGGIDSVKQGTPTPKGATSADRYVIHPGPEAR